MTQLISGEPGAGTLYPQMNEGECHLGNLGVKKSNLSKRFAMLFFLC